MATALVSASTLFGGSEFDDLQTSASSSWLDSLQAASIRMEEDGDEDVDSLEDIGIDNFHVTEFLLSSQTSAPRSSCSDTSEAFDLEIFGALDDIVMDAENADTKSYTGEIDEECEYTREETLIIFDWDDTLLPSSWLAANRLNLDPLCVVSASQQDILDSIAAIACRVIESAARYGRVVIVTNAETGWVEFSATKFMPSVLSVISNCGIEVISARSLYESKQFPTPYLWKIEAFRGLISRTFVLDETEFFNLMSDGCSEMCGEKYQEAACCKEDQHILNDKEEEEKGIPRSHLSLPLSTSSGGSRRRHTTLASSFSSADNESDEDDKPSVGGSLYAARRRCMSSPALGKKMDDIGEDELVPSPRYTYSLLEGFVPLDPPAVFPSSGKMSSSCLLRRSTSARSFDDAVMESSGCYMKEEVEEDSYMTTHDAFITDFRRDYYSSQKVVSSCSKLGSSSSYDRMKEDNFIAPDEDVDGLTTTAATSSSSATSSISDIRSLWSPSPPAVSFLRRKNILSFGDSESERNALITASGQLNSCCYKSFKFCERPQPFQLNQELQLIFSSIRNLIHHQGNLDLKVNWNEHHQ